MIDSVQNKEKLGFLCIGGNLDYLGLTHFLLWLDLQSSGSP